MTHPIKVNYDALTHDAGLWDEVAGHLGTGAQAAAGQLALAEPAFSEFAQLIAPQYETARALVEQLLRAGEEQIAGAATALRAVRADYESVNGEVNDQIRELWQPLGVE